ncbi:hypothetical protein VTN77DRAFT_2982 [Rasamsonia byssochlamydoides]|uniref:uncharacterized protein n=1 Tax=Rasamsonia byssochlamydoides TaxID=89139 RepID=UPI0037439894
MPENQSVLPSVPYATKLHLNSNTSYLLTRGLGGLGKIITTCRAKATTVLRTHSSRHLANIDRHSLCLRRSKIGNFVIGKEFDMLEIHTIDPENAGRSLGIITLIEDEDSTAVIFEKFLMTGDDRNIAKVYVRGWSIKAT